MPVEGPWEIVAEQHKKIKLLEEEVKSLKAKLAEYEWWFIVIFIVNILIQVLMFITMWIIDLLE